MASPDDFQIGKKQQTRTKDVHRMLVKFEIR